MLSRFVTLALVATFGLVHCASSSHDDADTSGGAVQSAPTTGYTAVWATTDQSQEGTVQLKVGQTIYTERTLDLKAKTLGEAFDEAVKTKMPNAFTLAFLQESDVRKGEGHARPVCFIDPELTRSVVTTAEYENLQRCADAGTPAPANGTP